MRGFIVYRHLKKVKIDLETHPLTIPDWLPDKKEIGSESTKPLDIPILIPFKQSDKTGNQVGFISIPALTQYR